MVVSWVITWNGQCFQWGPPQKLQALVRASWPSWQVSGGRKWLWKVSRSQTWCGLRVLLPKKEKMRELHVKYLNTDWKRFMMYPDSNLGPAFSCVEFTPYFFPPLENSTPTGVNVNMWVSQCVSPHDEVLLHFSWGTLCGFQCTPWPWTGMSFTILSCVLRTQVWPSENNSRGDILLRGKLRCFYTLKCLYTSWGVLLCILKEVVLKSFVVSGGAVWTLITWVTWVSRLKTTSLKKQIIWWCELARSELSRPL